MTVKMIFCYFPVNKYGDRERIVSESEAMIFENEVLYLYNDNEKGEYTYHFSNSLPFEIINCLIAEGRIDVEDVKFMNMSTKEDFSPNEYGDWDYSKIPKEFKLPSNYVERTFIAKIRLKRLRNKEEKYPEFV